MPFHIIRNDITLMETDAIVNAANSRLLPGGGVCGAIFAASDYNKLKNACAEIVRKGGAVKTGCAVMTESFGMKAKYVIHAVGPVYNILDADCPKKLYAAYRSSLTLAADKGLSSIAFPLISAGIYGYPKAEAFRIAKTAICDFLEENGGDMDVYLIVFDKKALQEGEKLFGEIKSLICERYVSASGTGFDGEGRERRRAGFLQAFLKNKKPHAAKNDEAAFSPSDEELLGSAPKDEAISCAPSVLPSMLREENEEETGQGKGEKNNKNENAAKPKGHPHAAVPSDTAMEMPMAMAETMPMAASAASSAGSADAEHDLAFLVGRPAETFSEMLLRLIDERGYKDSEVYKKANIDRKHFSKIRSDKNYKPKKSTVLSFAIALELSADETRDLLLRAGYALTDCSKQDIIVGYFIEKGIYDIYTVNEALFNFDEPLLGA